MTRPGSISPTLRSNPRERMASVAGRVMLSIAMLTAAPLVAQAAGPLDGSSPGAISPADAQRAVQLLQDDAKRAETIRALKAIADTAPGAPAAPAASSAPTTATAAAPTTAATATPAAAAPAAAPDDVATTAIVPLEANGLMARMLRSISQWVDGVSAQVAQVREGMKAVPDMVARANRNLATEAGQRLLRQVLTTLAAVFVVALLLEWALHRSLRQPRKALAQHADEEEAAERRQRHEEERQRVQAERQRQEAGRDQANEQQDAEDASLRSAPPGVALVQTTRDGIARVEAVPVPLDDGAAPPEAATATATNPDASKITLPVSGATASAGKAPPLAGLPTTGSDTIATGGAAGVVARDATLARDEAADKATRTAGRHWHTIRHLPYALASLVLDLLPLALFFIAAALMLRWLDGDDVRVHEAVTGFVHAYVTTRISMAVLRLLVSPVGHGLRVLHVSDVVSQRLQTGMRRIIVLALFGLAIADAAQILGVGAQARMILVKGFSLLVHSFAIALILRLRRPVARALGGKPGQTGPLAMLRHWLAHTWAVIAVVVVAGIWIVWALGVEDGFPKLMHFVVVTGGVIIVARISAMLLLGALGRMFQPREPDSATQDATVRTTVHDRLAGRYFPMVRGLVTVLIFLLTALTLLQVWGADVLDWFARGTLGRSIASALSTIAVSIVIAILVWESVHYAIERRLQQWKDQGDLLRAARLRTLLPMLRTLLMIAVILVVGLTALNEIGINTTPLLAGASIIGVAVGFGSQKLVQDFITGIFLLMENAMQVGDWVTVAGVSGSVEYLSIRTVRLRGGDGSLYIVPFSSVSTVNNTNRGLGNAAVRVSVAYDTDVELVIGELKKLGAAMREDPTYRSVILNDIEVWGVDAVDGSMVTVAGQIRCKDSGRWGVQREMNRRILDRFRELGIAIANPRASLLLTADEAPAELPDPAGPPARSESAKTPTPR
ncbi:mechanosensitive ion channel family protein [Bordetella sp. LUAb4]|uniref:mechanosensitive ion channel family protein n=1 Tax=Bordetella sp. LUAb4 TaxID=2843195 RepID=UPI001E4FFD3B|nr:mechanosensitive ion channel family protein [Bordetella sp. LUAb4]